MGWTLVPVLPEKRRLPPPMEIPHHHHHQGWQGQRPSPHSLCIHLPALGGTDVRSMPLLAPLRPSKRNRQAGSSLGGLDSPREPGSRKGQGGKTKARVETAWKGGGVHRQGPCFPQRVSSAAKTRGRPSTARPVSKTKKGRALSPNSSLGRTKSATAPGLPRATPHPAPDAQRSTKSRFRVTCALFSAVPRAGGARGRGAAGPAAGAVPAPAAPPEAAGRRRAPAPSRPQRRGPSQRCSRAGGLWPPGTPARSPAHSPQ